MVEVEAKYSNKSRFKKIYKEEFNQKSIVITAKKGGITPFLGSYFDGEIKDKNNKEIAKLKKEIGETPTSPFFTIKW